MRITRITEKVCVLASLSFVMDERRLFAAVRYVELNPVRASLCNSAGDWPWSRASAHLSGRGDGLVAVEPMLERVDNWEDYLSMPPEETTDEDLRQHSRSGRPAGDEAFIDALEALTGRRLKRIKPGPRPAKGTN